MYQLIWDPSWGRFTQTVVSLVPNGVMIERMTARLEQSCQRDQKYFKRKLYWSRRHLRCQKVRVGEGIDSYPPSRNPLSSPSQNWREGLKKCPAAPRSFERHLGGSRLLLLHGFPFSTFNVSMVFYLNSSLHWQKTGPFQLGIYHYRQSWAL